MAEFVVAASQAKSLLPGVKLLVPEALKASMDIEIIPNFIHYCELQVSLVSISNKYIKALSISRLFYCPAYTWFATQYCILDRNNPGKLNWKELKMAQKIFLNLKIMHLTPGRP